MSTDIVIDKAAMDTLLCADNHMAAASAIAEVFRILRVNNHVHADMLPANKLSAFVVSFCW